MGGETERPVDVLLKHTLDGKWVLAVVREVLVREHGGHEVDDSIHVGGHFAEGPNNWDDDPAVFTV